MEVREKIIETIEKAVKELKYPEDHVAIHLDRPKNEMHGDYSTNVALQVFKTNWIDKEHGMRGHAHGVRAGNEMDMAQKIVDLLNTKYQIPNTDHIEAVTPGFINVFLSKDFLISQLDEALNKGREFGQNDSLRGKKIMVEFTDPNPFKEFHIGHLYSNAVGESLSRLFESQGAQVWRANFFGDVGMHVAKALYGLLQKFKVQNAKFKVDEKLRELEKKSLSDRVKFLGQAYALGSTAYEKNEEAKEEMKQLNLLIFVAAQQYWQETKQWKPRVDYKKHVGVIDERELAAVKKLWALGRQWSLDYFELIYKRLGTKFDGYYPESLTGEWGYDFVLEGLKKGIFEENEGAVIYKGEKHGLHTRVFINKLGLPTYETKDIGNAPHKYSEFPYDKSLIVTANEINEYFKVVIAAMKEVNPKLGEKTAHLGHGVVKLPKGKMSSRTGEVVTGEWLLDETKRRISEQFQDIEEETMEQVAVGAVKYVLLKSRIGQDIVFDFGKSISLEGDSGPYLQYTYARTQSVLKKSQMTKPSLSLQGDALEAEEMVVMRSIHHFPEVVETATVQLSPNTLCHYLFDLAQKFNLFYQKHSILEGKNKAFRLLLTQGTGQVLANGLHLLGIAAPVRM